MYESSQIVRVPVLVALQRGIMEADIAPNPKLNVRSDHRCVYRTSLREIESKARQNDIGARLTDPLNGGHIRRERHCDPLD